MLINIDKAMEKSLTPSELCVIKYINQHEAEVAEQPITDLAEVSFTSPATVSRAIRKCGFSGIPELRRHIASKTSYSSEPYRMNEVLDMSYKECTNTIENLRISDILKIVEYIKTAQKIYILARGVTELTAREFEFQLQLQQYYAITISDSELMKRIDKLLHPEDFMIIFTAYNSTPEFGDAIQKAKPIGSKVAVCTCKEDTPLEAMADVTVIGYTSPIVPGNEFNGASRLPLQIISRTIIEYLAR